MLFAKLARRSVRLCVILLAAVVASYGAATISSQEFGASALGTPVTMSVAVAGVSVGPASESLSFGSDFSIGTCTPSGSGCALAVTFNPTKAGDRQDAVIVKDGQGNVAQEILLHGVGEGAREMILPGTATLKAEFSLPSGSVWYFNYLAAEPNGKILAVVASAPAQGDSLNSAIYELDPTSATWTPIFVPNVMYGFTFGISGLAVDGSGSIYYNGGYPGQDSIHRIDRATGVDSVWVPGNSTFYVTSLYADAQGTLYIGFGDQVFACDPNTQALTLVAGNETPGFSGDGGPAVSAELNGSSSLVKDRAGNLYVADAGNYRVRKIDTSGTITTFAGNGSQNVSGDGGPAIGAGLGIVENLALDGAGDVCMTGLFANLRCVFANGGLIETAAGGGTTGTNPFTAVGVSSSAQNLVGPGQLAIDSDGNVWVVGSIYSNVVIGGVGGIFELTNTVGPISFGATGYGQTRTTGITVANTGTAPLANLPSAAITGANASSFSESGTCNGALAPGNACALNTTFTGGLPGLSMATLALSDNTGQVLQSIALTATSGGIFPAVQTVGSVAVGSTSASPAAISVQFPGSAAGMTAELAYGIEFQLGGMQCAGQGTVSCTAQVTFAPKYPGVRQDAIRFLDASGAPVYETFLSGTGQGPLYFFDPAVMAGITTGLIPDAIDEAGNFYRYGSGVVEEMNAQTKQVSIVAGQPGMTGDSGDGGPATQAQLGQVNALEIDPAGNMFIVETNAVRRVDGKTGVILTVAQSGGDCAAIDGDGYLYMCVTRSSIVERLDPTTGILTTIAGNGLSASSGDGGPATAASIMNPAVLAFDGDGNLYIAESSGARLPFLKNVRRVDRASGIISTYTTICVPTSMVFDPAGNLYYHRCSDFEVLSPGAGSGYVIEGSFNGNPIGATSSIIRHPSGTLYFGSGLVLSPSLPSTITLPPAVVGGTPSTTMIELWNAGNANMAFSQLGFTTTSTPTGTGGGGFGGSGTCGANLAAGSNCTLTPSFAPGEVGPFAGAVIIDSNAGNQKAALSGIGASSAIFVKFSSWDYGSVPAGKPVYYDGVDFSAENIGPVPISISAALSGPDAGDFQIGSNSCPGANPIASYSTCDVSVSFVPTGAGAKTASLTLSASGVQPVVIPLSGTAFQMGLQKAIGGSWKKGITTPTAKDVPTLGTGVVGGVVLSDAPAETTSDGSELQRAKVRDAGESAPVVAAPLVGPAAGPIAEGKANSVESEARTGAVADPPAEIQAAIPNEKIGKLTSKSPAKKKGQKAKRKKLAKH